MTCSSGGIEDFFFEKIAIYCLNQRLMPKLSRYIYLELFSRTDRTVERWMSGWRNIVRRGMTEYLKTRNAFLYEKKKVYKSRTAIK